MHNHVLVNTVVSNEQTPSETTLTDRSRPIVVIDTCVLLADPSSLYAFPGSDIVLPLIVIEELDSKKSRADELGLAARTVLRTLEELRALTGGDLAKAVPIGSDSSVRIETNGLHLKKISDANLDVTKADNRIIAAALGLADSHPGQVSVCSLDTAFRIKASHVGLVANTFEPRTPTLLQPPPKLELDHATMEQLYSKNQAPATGPSLAALPENTGFIATSGTSSALARIKGNKIYKIDDGKIVYGLRGRSAEQRLALDVLTDTAVPIVALTGPAGTGKTILALAAALSQVFDERSEYDRLMVLRPIVAVGRADIGFLPGDMEAKLGPWFECVIDTLVALKKAKTHREARTLMESWVASDRLTLEATTFLRGRSLQSTFIITDEAQNLEPLVAKTILSRIGDKSKVVFLGDTSQIDSPWLSAGQNALAALVDHCTGSPLFSHIHLVKGERSPAANLAASMP